MSSQTDSVCSEFTLNSRRGQFIGQQREEFTGVVAIAQLLAGGRVAQQSGDTGKRLEVIGAGVLGREQQEDQIHRLVVDGVEVDRLLEAREQAKELFHLAKAAVGDGNAATHTGRAQAFAFDQNVQNGPFPDTGQFGRVPR